MSPFHFSAIASELFVRYNCRESSHEIKERCYAVHFEAAHGMV